MTASDATRTSGKSDPKGAKDALLRSGGCRPMPILDSESLIVQRVSGFSPGIAGMPPGASTKPPRAGRT